MLLCKEFKKAIPVDTYVVGVYTWHFIVSVNESIWKNIPNSAMSS